MYVVLVLVAILSTLAPMHAQTMLAALPAITPSQPRPELRHQTQHAAPRSARQLVAPSAAMVRPASLPVSAATCETLLLSSLPSLVLNYAPNAP